MTAGDTPAHHRFPAGAWFLDWSGPHEFAAHAVAESLFEAESPFQRIEILRTLDHGCCLVLNGESQSYEADEFIYHEALVHPALALHPCPRRVLVIGGGEGATIREVLRHRSVEAVTMVDLDAAVVAAARAHLPGFHAGAFDDPRVQLEFGDGRAFVESSAERFDVILIDINNPLDGSPSQRLFTEEFYRAVRARLAPGGLVTAQGGAAGPGRLACPATVRATLAAVFAAAVPASVFIPSFAVAWTFLTAGEGLEGVAATAPEVVDQSLAAREVEGLRYYDGAAHRHMFNLPRYLREGLASAWPTCRDDRLIVERYPGYTPS